VAFSSVCDGRMLGVPVRLLVPADVRDDVGAALRPLVAAAAPLGAGDRPAEIRIDRVDGAYSARSRGEAELTDTDPVALAVAALTALVVRSSPLLCVHAGVVSRPGGALAMPGVSGQGKTTLVAALVQAGFGYVSDEVLAIDRTDRRPHPFRRPLGIATHVRALLELDPVDPGPEPDPAAKRLVDPGRLGALGSAEQLTDIVLIQRERGSPCLTPAARSEAVTALLDRSFNAFLDSASSFHLAVELARHADVWLARYEDATDMAALLADRFGIRRPAG
jgi:hypothetical protein